MDIKRGDMVYILSGALRRHESKKKDNKDSSGDTSSSKRVGKVLYVDRKKNTVLVEGFNIVKRHSKPTQTNQQGGIVEKEAPIHRSRVALYSPEFGGPTRIGTKFVEGLDGRKTRVRICRKTGAEI